MNREGYGDVTEQLIGFRVQIVIDEDGTPNPPSLPVGTITAKLTGIDGHDYWLVHLANPVPSIRAKTGEEWTLLDLIIYEHWEGQSVRSLVDKSRSADYGFIPPLPIRLLKSLVPLDFESHVFDASKCAYFALGRIKRA